MDLWYISALWSTLYFANSKKSLFHLKLFSSIICAEDVFFHRCVSFLTIHFCMVDEQFKLDF